MRDPYRGFPRMKFKPIENGRFKGSRIFFVVGKIPFPGNQVRMPVPIDIRHTHTMGLGKFLENDMMLPNHLALFILCLLMPPDAIIMSRGTDKIPVSITLCIQGIDLRTILPQVHRVKYPVRLPGIYRTFPPPLRNDHIPSSIPIHISQPKSMRIPVYPGYIPFPDNSPLPDSIAFDRWRLQPDHLFGHRIIAQKIGPAIPVNIYKSRGLIAAITQQCMHGPVPGFISRVFIPYSLLTRQTDTYQIDPSVLVDIHTEIQKGIAELSSRRVSPSRSNLMPGPSGSLEPISARQDIQLAIPVDIPNSYPFRNKIIGDDMFFPPRIKDCFLCILGKREQGPKAQRDGK